MHRNTRTPSVNCGLNTEEKILYMLRLQNINATWAQEQQRKKSNLCGAAVHFFRSVISVNANEKVLQHPTGTECTNSGLEVGAHSCTSLSVPLPSLIRGSVETPISPHAAQGSSASTPFFMYPCNQSDCCHYWQALMPSLVALRWLGCPWLIIIRIRH